MCSTFCAANGGSNRVVVCSMHASLFLLTKMFEILLEGKANKEKSVTLAIQACHKEQQILLVHKLTCVIQMNQKAPMHQLTDPQSKSIIRAQSQLRPMSRLLCQLLSQLCMPHWQLFVLLVELQSRLSCPPTQQYLGRRT